MLQYTSKIKLVNYYIVLLIVCYESRLLYSALTMIPLSLRMVGFTREDI